MSGASPVVDVVSTTSVDGADERNARHPPEQPKRDGRVHGAGAWRPSADRHRRRQHHQPAGVPRVRPGQPAVADDRRRGGQRGEESGAGRHLLGLRTMVEEAKVGTFGSPAEVRHPRHRSSTASSSPGATTSTARGSSRFQNHELQSNNIDDELQSPGDRGTAMSSSSAPTLPAIWAAASSATSCGSTSRRGDGRSSRTRCSASSRTARLLRHDHQIFNTQKALLADQPVEPAGRLSDLRPARSRMGSGSRARRVGIAKRASGCPRTWKKSNGRR